MTGGLDLCSSQGLGVVRFWISRLAVGIRMSDATQITDILT
jgi:hypothetical protein